jgi:hypothetical protein
MRRHLDVAGDNRSIAATIGCRRYCSYTQKKKKILVTKNQLAETLGSPQFIPYRRQHLGVAIDKGSIAATIQVAAIDPTNTKLK